MEKPVKGEFDGDPQYYFKHWTSGNKVVTSGRNGNRSVVYITFNFDRAVGFYMLQIYIPLTIIVMSSWVSFWLVNNSRSWGRTCDIMRKMCGR